MPQEFTALVSVLFFRRRAYSVSSLAGREPNVEILAYLEQPALQPPHILLGHLNRVLAENSPWAPP